MAASISELRQVGSGEGVHLHVILLTLSESDARAMNHLLAGTSLQVMDVVRHLSARAQSVAGDPGGRSIGTLTDLPRYASASSTMQPLSMRERQVLRLLARGMRNREIADALFIGERTVKWHVNSIFRKLDVVNRTEAARTALRQGLVPLDESTGEARQAVA